MIKLGPSQNLLQWRRLVLCPGPMGRTKGPTMTTRKRVAHTASFLQTFHTGQTEAQRRAGESQAVAPEEEKAVAFVTGRDSSNYVAEYRGIQVKHGTGLITEPQAKYVVSIALDRNGVTEAMLDSLKTRLLQGFAKGAASQFISTYKGLPRKAPVAASSTTEEVEIPAHRYGIHKDGEVKCYEIDYGKADSKWAGFLFLNRISSDDRFSIRNATEKAEILAAIRADGIEASQLLAALTLRRCIRCGRQLSDTKNPYFTQGLGPDCGSK